MQHTCAHTHAHGKFMLVSGTDNDTSCLYSKRYNTNTLTKLSNTQSVAVNGTIKIAFDENKIQSVAMTAIQKIVFDKTFENLDLKKRASLLVRPMSSRVVVWLIWFSHAKPH